MQGGYDVRATQPEVIDHLIGLTGTGAANPTERYGPGVVVTRTASGVYLITWAESPGNFVGFGYGLGADTAGDVKGHTVTRGVYSASAKTLAFSVWNASETADDLQALEYLDLVVRFKTTGVNG